jgi:hypothetical protein
MMVALGRDDFDYRLGTLVRREVFHFETLFRGLLQMGSPCKEPEGTLAGFLP